MGAGRALEATDAAAVPKPSRLRNERGVCAERFVFSPESVLSLSNDFRGGRVTNKLNLPHQYVRRNQGPRCSKHPAYQGSDALALCLHSD